QKLTNRKEILQSQHAFGASCLRNEQREHNRSDMNGLDGLLVLALKSRCRAERRIKYLHAFVSKMEFWKLHGRIDCSFAVPRYPISP
ncbi:uncharacterized, partial [Tachysurus ichikawai]